MFCPLLRTGRVFYFRKSNYGICSDIHRSYFCVSLIIRAMAYFTVLETNEAPNVVSNSRLVSLTGCAISSQYVSYLTTTFLDSNETFLNEFFT